MDLKEEQQSCCPATLLTFGELKAMRQQATARGIGLKDDETKNTGPGAVKNGRDGGGDRVKRKRSKPKELLSTGYCLAPSTLRLRPGRGKEGRDPRFSDMSGQLNTDLFSSSYDFLEGMREEEKDGIKKEATQIAKTMKKKKIFDEGQMEAMANRRDELTSQLCQMKSEDGQRKRLTDEVGIRRRMRRAERDRIVKTGKKDYHISKTKVRTELRNERDLFLQDKPRKLSKAITRNENKKLARELKWRPSRRRE